MVSIVKVKQFAPLHRTHHIFAYAWISGTGKDVMSAVKGSEIT